MNPHWKQIVQERLAALCLPPARELEIVEEVALHLEAIYEDAVLDGLSEAEAQSRAIQSYDWRLLECELSRAERPLSVGALQKPMRLIEQGVRMESLLQDLRFGVRMLRTHKGFTLIAVLTLSLGIGANTAIFSVVNALLLRSLPYADAERLFWVEEVSKTKTGSPAAGHFLDWQQQARTLEGIAAQDGATRTLTGVGEPERVEVGKISANFFTTLGVLLTQGRNFTAAEDAPGGARVAVLSHGLWQRRYHSDPSIIGRSVTLNDASFTVIGVLPANFHYFRPFDVWVPLAIDLARDRANGNIAYLPTTIARLNPGVTPEQARAELETILRRYEMTKPEGTPRLIENQTKLVALREHLLGETRRPLLVLLGAVALVLLIACANVANLSLARAETRRKELGIRAAMGASRWRLVRQLLTECLLLSLAGGAIGLLLASWLTKLLNTLSATDTLGEMGRVATITIDPRVLGFTLLLSLLTGLLFGLLPALRLSRPDLSSSLKEGGRGSGFHGRGLRNTLMVSEVALAIVLLIGAGLLIRSFIKLRGVDPGYRAENLLTAQIALPPRYNEKAQRVQFYDRLLPRLAALPGIVSVGATSHLPLRSYNLGAMLSVEGRAPLNVPISVVNSDYFRTLGISLRAGRLLNDGDTIDTPSVALLSETLADRLFPNEDPLGKQFKLPGSDAELTTVVGVVSDTRHKGLDREVDNALYLSYRQTPRGMALLLRSTVAPLSLVSSVRDAVHEMDAGLAVYDVMTMDERLSGSIATRRFNLWLLGSFATLALTLAGIGVYGVIAYVVTERTHEIGIRLALGAQQGDVLRLLIKQGMWLVLLGVGLGLLGAFALTRVMTSLLFGVNASDPLTFAGVALLLTFVALLACWIPARRATKVDPMIALRSE